MFVVYFLPVLLFGSLIKVMLSGVSKPRSTAIAYGVLMFVFYSMVSLGSGGSYLGLLIICASAGITSFPFYKLIDDNGSGGKVAMYGIGGGISILVVMRVIGAMLSGDA